MVEAAIIQIVQCYIKAIEEQGITVEYGVLFGSYARNQPHEWSDIDVMVVSEQFDEQLRREDVQLLWRVAAHIDSRIEPIAVGRRQYESGDESMIVEIARREGHIIHNKPVEA
ncbi:MAG: nucleotidyltransferase domain-containing protein [Anaerolineae bacterium]|nr:nucleotidyltransferase domain-containing protein [Anaerolineae bacterium]